MSDFEVELLDLRDLLNTPEPEWLIQDHIHECEVGVIYGPANVGKSFVVLDWAMSVATGTPWLGRYLTKQAPVLYLAGEGAASLNKRVDAWMKFHKEYDAPILFQTRPLPLREDEVIADIQDALLTAYEDENGCIGDVRPGLIIVDTLSQFMMGGDENGADMALFVANLRHLSQEQSAAIVIVHHTNKGKKDERGHTALRGNVDVMFRVNGSELDGQLTTVTLLNDKQRDNARAAPVTMVPSAHKKSLILSWVETPEPKAKGPKTPAPMRTQDMLAVLATAEDGLTWGEWRITSGIGKDIFNRRIRKLTDNGEILKENGRYYLYPSNKDIVNLDGSEDE